MGAWGAGPFENDDAGDWVWELEDDTDGTALVDVLQAAIDADEGELELDEADNAVAAAAIIASSRGERRADLPTEASVWLDSHSALVTDEFIALARRALARVVADSEAREIWDEAGDPAWLASANEILDRLS